MDGVILGIDVNTSQDIILSTRDRFRGLSVIGTSGTGKTNLLLSLALQDAEQQHGLCFLDPHGDAVDALLQRVMKRHDDVILLDVESQDSRFGLNMFEIDDPTNEGEIARRTEQVVEIFKLLWAGASWGPRLEDMLRIASYTLMATPGSTLAEIPRLLKDATFRRQLVDRVTNEEVQRYWGIYDSLPPHVREERNALVLNRIRAFLLNPLVASIVGQRESTIDFREAMNTGKIVLVKLSRGLIGDDAASVLGSLIGAMLANAAALRSDEAPAVRRPFFIYADEYHRFATDALLELLREGGTYGVGVITALQTRAQLAALGPAISGTHAANIAVFRVRGEDANDLAVEFDTVRPRGGHSFSQSRAETAQMLADLPPYTAQVRMVESGTKVEHTIRTRAFSRLVDNGIP